MFFFELCKTLFFLERVMENPVFFRTSHGKPCFLERVMENPVFWNESFLNVF